MKKGFYNILVYIAYAFFLALGGFWFFQNLATNGHFNYSAFGIIVIFVLQFIFRRRLVNLVLGIITLICSIWMLLDTVEIYNMFAKKATVDSVGKMLIGLSIISIIMSGILIFSYQTLNKENMEKGQ